MRLPMASSIRRSSSFLVTITTGSDGLISLISASAVKPSLPGIVSSSKTRSNVSWRTNEIASSALADGRRSLFLPEIKYVDTDLAVLKSNKVWEIVNKEFRCAFFCLTLRAKSGKLSGDGEGQLRRARVEFFSPDLAL